MFTDVDADSLYQVTTATILVGLAFTAGLLVVMGLIARAMGWGRDRQDEEKTAKRHPEVPQAA